MTETLLFAQVVGEKMWQARQSIIEVIALSVGAAVCVAVFVALVVLYGTVGR